MIFLAFACATSTPEDTADRPYDAGDGPYDVTVEPIASGSDGVTLYHPQGATDAPVIVWTHGFARFADNHASAAPAEADRDAGRIDW